MGKLYELDCRPACQCPPLPFSLLSISRAVSEEVSHILYSENSFTISKSGSWGLKPLRNLNTAALSSLRILSVRLNSCECLYKVASFQSLRGSQGPELQGLFTCHPLCQGYGIHDKPLRSRARQHAAVLHEWQNIVGKLNGHCQLDSLKLDLVCDTRDVDTAQDVVDLLSPLQYLRACPIRLSQNPSWQHSALARGTVSRLLGGISKQTAGAKPKTYTYYLPPEILSRILEYSELVAPFDLEWCPDRGLVSFDCCTKCTATLDFCACSFYHGAHSLTCTCWRLPLHIFLVSRQVYEISKTIFFQRNRFIILPKGGRMDDLMSSQVTVPGVLEWFEGLPRDTPRLLRPVGLAVMLPDSVADAAPDTRLLAEWEMAVGSLFAACDGGKLRNLSLFMGHGWELGRGPEPNGALRSSYEALGQSVRGGCGGCGGLSDLFLDQQQEQGQYGADHDAE